MRLRLQARPARQNAQNATWQGKEVRPSQRGGTTTGPTPVPKQHPGIGKNWQKLRIISHSYGIISHYTRL